MIRPQTANPAAAKARGKVERPQTAPTQKTLQDIKNKLQMMSLTDAEIEAMDINLPESYLQEGKTPRKVIGNLSDKLPEPTPQTAHKRYTSVYPCCSTILAKKWDDVTWKKHKQKIKSIRACVDNCHSEQAPSVLRSNKKNVAKKEMEKKITRENQILLERMARTFSKPSAFTNFEAAHSRTKKDLENKSKANLRKRQQTNEKIGKENEILHLRLENKKANYEKNKWAVERREHLRLLMKMTKFPEAYTMAVEREKEMMKKKPKPQKAISDISSHSTGSEVTKVVVTANDAEIFEPVPLASGRASVVESSPLKSSTAGIYPVSNTAAIPPIENDSSANGTLENNKTFE